MRAAILIHGRNKKECKKEVAIRTMNLSPIRYPGGKAQIAPKIGAMIDAVSIRNCVYVEPFAGGAGVALSLLFSGKAEEIVINDLDKAVCSFWRSILNKTDDFIETIQKTPITIDEWRRQKDIYVRQSNKLSFELGFAFFFLNRTNRSGILTGGPIGGFEQKGNWKIDCRFNKENLISRITAIAAKRNKIRVYNQDVFDFIRIYLPKYQKNGFVYFDPPYYNKAGRLYRNSFASGQHVRLRESILSKVEMPWVVSYDDVPEIRNIYEGVSSVPLDVTYSAAKKKRELNECFFVQSLSKVIFSFNLRSTYDAAWIETKKERLPNFQISSPTMIKR